MGHHVTRTVSFHAPLRRVESQWQPAAGHQPAAAPAPDEQSAQEDVSEAAPTPMAAPANVDKLVALLEEINEHVGSIQDARARNLRELQELAIELGVAIAAHLIKEKLVANELNLVDLVQAAISRLVPADRITVSLHPEDALDLSTLVEGALSRFREHIEVVHDGELPRGACFVVGDDHGLLSTLEHRLETVRETLLQGIEYARTEHGKAFDTGGTLRRFPDRRQLA